MSIYLDHFNGCSATQIIDKNAQLWGSNFQNNNIVYQHYSKTNDHNKKTQKAIDRLKTLKSHCIYNYTRLKK